ncbi:bacillithiol biosynthesis cysteine-adding enzyme BshC [Exiguobacterium sp. PHA03]|uniref:bacillithiol biosynthesis cysteine-adding enzyme BshC n=1 Tax=Exiguobacterium sp. PHA03 TaxID=3064895 RepID=UPI0035BF7C19
MKVQPFEALYDDNSLMHRASREEFLTYVDHLGTSGLASRSRLLEERHYPHLAALTDELERQNPNMTERLRERVAKLRTGEAQAVVTGQQTGIFGGPLYAIYKLLTCLKVAQQAEATLDRPVVPIFWLATEDHDFDEINHVYVPTADFQTRKIAVAPAETIARSVSRLSFDQPALLEIIEETFRAMPETIHTKRLVARLKQLVEECTSYGMFFSQLIGELIDFDIVFFDADTHPVRELEIPFFERLIQDNAEFRQALTDGITQTKELPDTFLNEEAAHLFIDDHGRQLLYPTASGFETKQGKQYTELELIALLYASPERFSNSVVTRPLMQDYLFPTLAYIGGPGELAYWTRLRPLFHHLKWTMPLLIPRMGGLLVRHSDEKRLMKLDVSLEEIVRSGVPIPVYSEEQMTERLQTAAMLKDSFVSEFLSLEHQLLRTSSKSEKIKKQLKQSIASLLAEDRRQFDRQTRQYKETAYHLLPDGAPQERIHSILPWLNHHGPDFVRDLRNAYEANAAEQLKIFL